MGRKRKNIEPRECPKEEEVEQTPQVPEKMELSAKEREEHDRLDREYFDRLPPGYRFLPTGDELIIDYLSKKVSNLPLPKHRIRDANIYNLHPQQLTSMYKLHREKEWYFFTPRSKKYPNGQRPDRSAGNGFWKATGADTNIPETGIKIGTKKTLVYYEGKSKDKNGQTKTDWIMHEYKLYEGNNTNNNVGPGIKKDASDMRLDEWVLCKIYKKTIKSKEPNDIQQEEEPVPNPNPNENEKVPNPSTEEMPNGVHFVNEVGFPVQNEQVLDPSTKQDPDGMGSVNISTFVLHNEQVPNPNNTIQGQDGAGFDNTVSFFMQRNEPTSTHNTNHEPVLCYLPNDQLGYHENVIFPSSHYSGFDNTVSFSMQHSEQTSTPNTNHEPVLCYLPNDQLGYHENVSFPSSHYSTHYGMLPFNDHQAVDMFLLESSSTYHIHSQDTLQGPLEVFDYPPPLDYKDERQEPLNCKDGQVPQRLDDTTARPNQALSSKETKTK